ncbi:MAG: UDP-N-acetylmuramate dehydrogenase [Bacteroidota bacterium]
MHIYKNMSLKRYNTFGVDYMADTIIHVRTEKEVRALLKREISWKKPLMILGGGSNILFTYDYRGTIIIPELKRMIIEEIEGEHIIVSAGAGIEWDRFVDWTVTMGFCGLENLSGIPGSVGAVPVHNIGAYGIEAKDYVIKVRTIDIDSGKAIIFVNEECYFGYRTSIFKTTFKGRFLITRVYFRLDLNFNPNLEYGTLRQEVEKEGKPTLKKVRDAVLRIRQSKLPDHKVIGNAGSFFKNPLVEEKTAGRLLKEHPGMPVYNDPSGMKKLAAGWLIEQCGWKGKRTGDAGVHEKQALVLVNYGNATGKEIYDLSERIRKSVKRKFGVALEREVELVGA